MATGRKAGVGCRDEARGTSYPPPGGCNPRRPGTQPPPATPLGSFLATAGRFAAAPGAALTHPPAVADSGNKTSPTAGSAGRRGLGRVTAGQTRRA